jgi:hypothetical protein
MDTPTICMVASCYSRLIEIYDETFKYVKRELETRSRQQSAPRLQPPSLRIGHFCFKDDYQLQFSIIVRIFLYNLRDMEKYIGISRDLAITRGEEAHSCDRGEDVQLGGECERHAPVAGGSDRLSLIISVLETEGPGGHGRSIESLRGNVARVLLLLERAPL